MRTHEMDSFNLPDELHQQSGGAMSSDEMLVTVQREWNGWRTAFVRVGDLQEIHWFQPTGAPRSLIHAYVNCADLIDGEIPHDCESTPRPHRLLVCVLKSHTTVSAYTEIARSANQAIVPFGSGSALPASGTHSALS